jgi:hypothetical protein
MRRKLNKRVMMARYELRMPVDLKTWTKANGGDGFVRALLEQERARRVHMDDRALIALIKERGIQWVSEAVRGGGIAPALDEGIDLTNWWCEAVPGAVYFYQVERRGGPTGRQIMRSGLGAPRELSSGMFTTGGPRVMWINDVPGSAWDAIERGGGESGVTTTFLYSDGTEHRVTS